jgi:glycosyltransferase involved in cell wall biosynthesis
MAAESRVRDLIKVGIWFDRPVEYSGGLNYIRNLLHAIHIANRNRIRVYLFVGSQIDEKLVSDLSRLAQVVRTPVLDRYSPWWFLDRFLVKFMASHRLVARELQKRGIAVLSHAAHVSHLGPGFRIIAWYPDFQFLHLPEMFPGLDVNEEIGRIRGSAARADAIVVSSHAALADFESIAPAECLKRTRVLQFVSQPAHESALTDISDEVKRRYSIEGRYFHLPNQFWQHKNHWVVAKALSELKRQGVEIKVICTGNLVDYRLPKSTYVEALRSYVSDQGLEQNLVILGLIPYSDALQLMRGSVAVINPSRFEGWSSTVEEAKSMGKKLIVSDIPVHREQNPTGALFFAPDDVAALSALLLDLWTRREDDDAGAANAARAALVDRTLAFGENYIELLEELVSIAKRS